MPTGVPMFTLDSLLVSCLRRVVGGRAWWRRRQAHRAVRPACCCWPASWLPFLIWCAMIGFVIYVHHTHTACRVARGATELVDALSRSSRPPSTCTFALAMGALLHHIMEHTAHHVDMSIPLYRLKRAQARLEELLPGKIVIQPFSWRWYLETARRCKLYDFERQCWTDYAGRPTSTPAIA